MGFVSGILLEFDLDLGLASDLDLDLDLDLARFPLDFGPLELSWLSQLSGRS